MSSCKDCVHYEVCGGFTPTDLDKDVFDYCREGRSDEIPNIEERCSNFKPKSRFVELPCEVGSTVYRIWSAGKHGKSVADFIVTSISQIAKGVWVVKYQKPSSGLYHNPTRYQCNLEAFGKTVFLSRDDAEKALAERSK